MDVKGFSATEIVGENEIAFVEVFGMAFKEKINSDYPHIYLDQHLTSGWSETNFILSKEENLNTSPNLVTELRTKVLVLFYVHDQYFIDGKLIER